MTKTLILILLLERNSSSKEIETNLDKESQV